MSQLRSHHRSPSARRRAVAGLTLVELLVAMTIGLVLIAFPVQGTNDSYTATCAATSAAMPNADTITVRRASTITVPPASASGPLRICSTRTSGLLVTDITGTFCQDVDTKIYNLIVNLYYVDQSSSQAGVPSLRSKALNGPAACTAPASPLPC